MQLYIFDGQTEALQAVLSTADGEGCPFYSAIHTEQLMNAETTAQAQAENSFDFYVPADKSDAQYVVEGNLVAFRDIDGSYQLFEIRKVDEFHTDTLYKQAYCVHAAPTELVDEWVSNLGLSAIDATTALTNVLNGTRWSVGTVDLTNSESVNIQRTNVLSGLAVLLATWGGEMQYRVEIVGNAITNRYVDWLTTVGSVTGKRFEYGKDTVGIQRTIDTTNVKTALYGYGQQDNNGNYLDFSSVVWTTPTNPVDKPAGQDWVGDPNALAQWGRANGTRNRFGSFVDSQQTDAATLLQETWNYLQTVNTPLVSYQMSVVDLETLMGYSWESVRIGDTANAIDSTFQPVLRLTARVVEIQRDLIEPSNTQITLGNFLPTLAPKQTQLQKVQQTNVGLFDGAVPNTLKPGAPVKTNWFEGVIDVLRNQVQSLNGYVYITDTDGILVLDKPIDQNPTKALKLGGGELAIANSQTNGAWNWSTFGTGDGFVADLIISGAIQTSKVTISGDTNFYWTGSNLYVADPSNANNQIRIGKYDGTNYGIAFTTDGGTTWIESMNFSGILGSAIQAKSIYVSSLITSGGDNLCTNSQFAGHSGSDWDAGQVEATGTSGGGNAPAEYCMFQNIRDNFNGPTFDVNPGDKFYVEAYVYTPGGSAYDFGIGLRFVDDAGNYNWIRAWTAPSTTTSWTKFAGVVAVPSGYRHARIWAQNSVGNAPATDPVGYYFTAVQVRKVVGTALIDTAAIGTAQIQDAAITDAKVSDLNVSKLTAGTIDLLNGVLDIDANQSSSTVPFRVNIGNVSSLWVDGTGRVGTALSTMDDGAGNMDVGGGLVVSGSKSAIVKTDNHGEQLLYCIESPENWFEDPGESQTDATGQVIISLDDVFAETVDTRKLDYKVFITGIDATDFKVPTRTAQSFTVTGSPNSRFMYRILAKRRDYAHVRFNPPGWKRKERPKNLKRKGKVKGQ